MEIIKAIDAVNLLELVEDKYHSGGINAVIQWVEKEFPIGTFLNLNQGIQNEKIYCICNLAIYQTDSSGNVTNFAYKPKKEGVENCHIARVLALPYVDGPFQFELYGTEVNGMQS